MISPVFSIIVPAYNVEQYLPRCLDSLLKGQGTQTEVIAVDDCSTDGTAELLRQYAVKHPHLRVFTHETNQGVSAARNTALDAAQGDYILFVDADDRLHEGAVPALLAMIGQTKPDIVHFQFQRVDECGAVCSRTSQMPEALFNLRNATEWRRAFAGALDTLVACNGCFRRDLLTGLRFGPYCNGEDSLFALQAFCRASSILTTPCVLYDYLQRVGSASRTWTIRRLRSVASVCGEMVRAVQESGHGQEVSDLLFRKVRGIAEGPLLNTVLRLDCKERNAAWGAWFDGMQPIYGDGGFVPRSSRWVYWAVFRVRRPWVVRILLQLPMTAKQWLLRGTWFRRRWGSFRARTGNVVA